MKKIIKPITIILLIVFTISLIYFIGNRIYHTFEYGNNSYYSFYSAIKRTKEKKTLDDEEDNEIYETIIETDMKYTNQSIPNKEWVIDYIEKEAKKQEMKCKNNLSNIEEEIKKTTKIYGVNLCELSEETANEIKEALKYIYEKYPFIKEYVTNISLVNDGGTSSYIAAFKPSFTYMTSNTSNRFPFVIKIQVFLNAAYYLNDKYFDLIIDNASNTKHFPKSTTKTSLVVHEFGHVITYVLAIKNYNSINTILLPENNFSNYATTLKEYATSAFAKLIIEEAYNDYIKSNSKESKEEFRKNISGYANSNDGNGDIIYNETVAEAFHDYYLNESNAKPESLAIMNIINKYIERLG